MHHLRNLAAVLTAGVIAAIPALTSASNATARTASASSATVTAAALPTIKAIPAGSGTHGYPYDAVPAVPAIAGAPAIDLAARGYVEREFTLSGAARTYRQNGIWGSNGLWSAAVAGTVPYTTRLLVRYPTDPAKFNGTVVVEWLNDTTGGDQDPVWSELYSHLLGQGYAYVGVTAQTAGMSDLKTWDPARYGTLGDTSDASRTTSSPRPPKPRAPAAPGSSAG